MGETKSVVQAEVANTSNAFVLLLQRQRMKTSERPETIPKTAFSGVVYRTQRKTSVNPWTNTNWQLCPEVYTLLWKSYKIKRFSMQRSAGGPDRRPRQRPECLSHSHFCDARFQAEKDQNCVKVPRVIAEQLPKGIPRRNRQLRLWMCVNNASPLPQLRPRIFLRWPLPEPLHTCAIPYTRTQQMWKNKTFSFFVSLQIILSANWCEELLSLAVKVRKDSLSLAVKERKDSMSPWHPFRAQNFTSNLSQCWCCLFVQHTCRKHCKLPDWSCNVWILLGWHSQCGKANYVGSSVPEIQDATFQMRKR